MSLTLWRKTNRVLPMVTNAWTGIWIQVCQDLKPLLFPLKINRFPRVSTFPDLLAVKACRDTKSEINQVRVFRFLHVSSPHLNPVSNIRIVGVYKHWFPEQIIALQPQRLHASVGSRKFQSTVPARFSPLQFGLSCTTLGTVLTLSRYPSSLHTDAVEACLPGFMVKFSEMFILFHGH